LANFDFQRLESNFNKTVINSILYSMSAEIKDNTYNGFEQGPIRPPSEARSLFIRVTRNCPWNRCTFCPVYKGAKFSVRPVEHVINDIDMVDNLVRNLLQIKDESDGITRDNINKAIQHLSHGEMPAFYAAYNWIISGGMKSVFIQDANSLIIKPHRLIEILKHIKKRFPSIERITSYARSHTIARMKDEDVKAIGEAGLNRIHIGLESGSDTILDYVKKGSTKEVHIAAGLKVKNAGIELSEYYMPGLGGQELYKEHALETADALNKINPDFIRLRTLAISGGMPLYDEYSQGRFNKCSDLLLVEELIVFLKNLKGITSYITSDHILNLFADLEGRLPRDKVRMVAVLQKFLSFKPYQQNMYRLGRRLGVFMCLEDMEKPNRRARVERAFEALNVTPENIDSIIDNLMQRFI